MAVSGSFILEGSGKLDFKFSDGDVIHPESTARSLFEFTHADVSALAHQYWQERVQKNQPGSAQEDWLKAEAELTRRRESAIDEASQESFPASDPPAL